MSGTDKGKRYDQKTKDKIIQFIEDFNAENGRGGQTAAVKKYGVSALTISRWWKQSKESGGGSSESEEGTSSSSPAPKPYTGKRRGRKPKNRAVVETGGAEGVRTSLERMVEIQAEIDSLREEYASLKDQL